MDFDFYVSWLSSSNPTPIKDAIAYVVGSPQNSCPKDIEFKIEYLVERISSLKESPLSIEDKQVVSPIGFTSMMYQYISEFPKALNAAYAKVAGKSLVLEDNSPIRQVYNEYAKHDSWKLKEACRLISHSHPLCSEHDGGLFKNKIHIPYGGTYLFPNLALYETNHRLAQSSIDAGKLRSIKSAVTDEYTIAPLEFLAWAKSKKREFHPQISQYHGMN